MNDLSTRIKQARARTTSDQNPHKAMSQEEFADALGVSRSAVANWEAGNNWPDLQNLSEIAKLTGVAFEWLATGRGPMVFGDPVRASEERGRYVTDAEMIEAIERLEAMPKRKRRAFLELTKPGRGD